MKRGKTEEGLFKAVATMSHEGRAGADDRPDARARARVIPVGYGKATILHNGESTGGAEREGGRESARAKERLLGAILAVRMGGITGRKGSLAIGSFHFSILAPINPLASFRSFSDIHLPSSSGAPAPEFIGQRGYLGCLSSSPSFCRFWHPSACRWRSWA